MYPRTVSKRTVLPMTYSHGMTRHHGHLLLLYPFNIIVDRPIPASITFCITISCLATVVNISSSPFVELSLGSSYTWQPVCAYTETIDNSLCVKVNNVKQRMYMIVSQRRINLTFSNHNNYYVLYFLYLILTSFSNKQSRHKVSPYF